MSEPAGAEIQQNYWLDLFLNKKGEKKGGPAELVEAAQQDLLFLI